MRIEEYLDKVSGEIKWKDARKPVREELRAHILERAEEYRSAGEAAEEAEARAVANMGDAAQTGKELNRLHRPRYDWVLMGALAGLLALGLFHLNSLTYIPKTSTWILTIVSGIIACCLFAFIDYRRLFASKFLSIGLYFIFLAVTFTAGFLHGFAVPEGSGHVRDLIGFLLYSRHDLLDRTMGLAYQESKALPVIPFSHTGKRDNLDSHTFFLHRSHVHHLLMDHVMDRQVQVELASHVACVGSYIGLCVVSPDRLQPDQHAFRPLYPHLS